MSALPMQQEPDIDIDAIINDDGEGGCTGFRVPSPWEANTRDLYAQMGPSLPSDPTYGSATAAANAANPFDWMF